MEPNRPSAPTRTGPSSGHPADAPPPGQQTETRSVVIGEVMPQPAPQLPHEIDESGHSQTQGRGDSASEGPRDVIRQAGEDLERGLQDTSMAPPMDDTYRRTQGRDAGGAGGSIPASSAAQHAGAAQERRAAARSEPGLAAAPHEDASGRNAASGKIYRPAEPHGAKGSGRGV